MNKRFFITYIWLLASVQTYAQEKQFEHRDMAWFAYFNQTRVTDKSGLWADVHLRLNDDYIKEVNVILARLAYTYYFSDKARLLLGYAYQNLPGHRGAPDVTEHRPWQQIQWYEKKNWFSMMQWFRLEQRFLKTAEEESFDFRSHRIRYNISFTIPLTRKEVAPKTPFLFVNNEVFINFGKNIVNNYFDQNRAFVGFGYQFTSNFNAQLGYMNVFQQLPAGNQYIKTDAVRLFIFHNLDFR